MNALTSHDFALVSQPVAEWLVLGCSPTRTLALAAALKDRGAWTPTWTRRRRLPRSSIFRLVTEPVIPGMVFIPSSMGNDLPAIPRVPFWLTRMPDATLMRVPDRQMGPLRRIADKPLVPAHQLPRIGSKVRFTQGPFEGIRGKVLSCTIRCAMIEVEGFALPVQVPPLLVEKV